jgi:hypothetical protein
MRTLVIALLLLSRTRQASSHERISPSTIALTNSSFISAQQTWLFWTNGHSEVGPHLRGLLLPCRLVFTDDAAL